MNRLSHVVLGGSERIALPGAIATGAANPDEQIELTIKLRRKTSLPELTGRPDTLLTRDDLAKKYGASETDVKKVKEVLESYGLRIVDENTAARSIRVSGTIDEVENAFLVKLFYYHHATKGDYRGRTGKIHLPAALEGIITGVFGLDNRPVVKKRRRNHEQHSSLSLATAKHRTWFYPSELADIYNFPKSEGAGQSIGILEFGGGYFQNDLAAFCKSANIQQPKVIPVSVGHASTIKKDGAEGEVMLDIEVVAGVCPQATIPVYFSHFSEQGWVDAVDTAIHDTQNQPNVISISWGYAEDAPGVWSKGAIDTINDSFKEAATLGITVLVASGDDGSDDQVGDGHAHVDFPSSSPYVLAVGGTAVKVRQGKVTETAWKEGDGLRKDNGGSTGGGVSVHFPRPAWQNVSVQSVNPGAISGRVIPDVAANAAGSTGYFVVVDGQSNIYGGTSAAAPLWASLIGRINALLPPGKKAGYVTPLLYQPIPGDSKTLGTIGCKDITRGDNNSAPVGGYSAVAGYDAATGWGSPDGTTLLSELLKIV